MKYDPKFLELNRTTVFEFLHFMLGFGHEQLLVRILIGKI